ncbi:beta-propeller domain-containing protein [Candidatus Micrarchaeota archaeon]|nr:beta-propeller domain-containing protein [Candidatus Micrarchaeota archaeon]
MKKIYIILVGIVILLAGCTGMKKTKEPPIEFEGGLSDFVNFYKWGFQKDSDKVLGKNISAIPKFDSCNELAEYLKNSNKYGNNYKYFGTAMPLSIDAEAADSTLSYSSTNIQVEGVDEADIVKTDGNYIYLISKSSLYIVKAYPAEKAEILSKVELEGTPYELFIDGNSLLVFTSDNEDISYYQEGTYPELRIIRYHKWFTKIKVYDISSREKPKLARSVDFEGNYLESRKIGSYVYFVIQNYPTYAKYYVSEKAENTLQVVNATVPWYKDSKGSDSYGPIANCTEIGYLPSKQANSLTVIGSVSMKDFDEDIQKEVIATSGQNIYASKENIYIAQTDYWVGNGYGSNKYESKENTQISKFSLDGGEIHYIGEMEAPGHILNQFSMDEFDGNFRIATTVGQVTREGSYTSNNIYIFDEDLEMVGKLEDLAPGEKIYSARFMGKKAYLVTFKKVDPLFVLDLSNPKNPKVLGKLKIPGYSDYLHPIDENHLIGLGKDTVEAEEGDFAWYQGIKMAIFDVSDVEKPKEMDKVIIGDRGTESYALNDHKAFLYSKDKNLLVIPVLLAEISEEEKDYERANAYGEYVFQGAYVYEVLTEDGFKLKGRISHYETGDLFKKSGSYFYGDGNNIKRSLYIEDALYTISDNKLMASSLDDLSLIKELKLN